MSLITMLIITVFGGYEHAQGKQLAVCLSNWTGNYRVFVNNGSLAIDFTESR